MGQCWRTLVGYNLKTMPNIDLAKLNAMLKGINLKTVLETLTGKVRVHTKAASEIFIRRRLNTLKDLVKEYKLTVDMTLVTSIHNMSDRLTRMIQWWFNVMKKENGPTDHCCPHR